MEKYTMVKSEVQDNGDIFLFYMDEDDAGEPSEDGGVVSIDQNHLQQLQENFIIEEVPMEQEEPKEEKVLTEDTSTDQWSSEELKRLLIFYTDNKQTIQNNWSNDQHLWQIACKTMLTKKNPASCKETLNKLRQEYVSAHLNYVKNNVDPKIWPHYELCYRAFNDDDYVKSMLNDSSISQTNEQVSEDNTTVTSTKPSKVPDETMKQVLNMYLQYRKTRGNDNSWQKYVWQKIAIQMGEDDVYWHKRFFNFKQHYIKLLEQRKNGAQNISWPYMDIFDEIFGDDEEFKRKYIKTIKEIVVPNKVQQPVQQPVQQVVLEWDDTENIVLIKYCYDCFDEFQDPTIPNAFLWNEIGRLLDRSADSCMSKYDELKTDHLKEYIAGGYNMQTRKPIQILFDNLLSKETEKVLTAFMAEGVSVNVTWETETFDELVQFLFDNIELFKDPICHFVCWAVIAYKLGVEVQTCREQWKQLVTLYKSILDEKREDSDLQIDWRYIDLFDRIFDYGMDTNLLNGYEKPAKIVKKKIHVSDKKPKLEDVLKTLSDSEEFDEKSTGKRSRGTEDPKAVKILEYYYKNKDKFATSQRKKHALWEILAKQLGVTAEQCAHRLRNLKQIYTAYIHREVNKPDMPVLWPYFTLCKKVFGYRAIKNKIKTGKLEPDHTEEWSAKEIKAIINHFANHFLEINENTDDLSKWDSLAQEIGKSSQSCRDKFLDLRRSYRKIKTMISKNRDCKVNWKYFKMFEAIYTRQEFMELDSGETVYAPLELASNDIKTEITGDDDFQCIIVIPEGEDVSNLNNAQIIVKETPPPAVNPTPEKIRWRNKHKLTLLKHIYDYVKERKGKLIDLKEMWAAMALKMGNRSEKSCKLMYVRLKIVYKKLKDDKEVDKIKNSTIFGLLQKILALKPKFVRTPFSYEEVDLKEQATYTDVPMPLWRVEKILKYYLDHVEEFIHPKYDKKYAWIDLAKHCEAPLLKAFKKINYLKQFFDSETNQVNGVKLEFADMLSDILQKEFICRIAVGNLPEPSTTDEAEASWSEEETDQLLQWYLNNLEKFKNPKYVPSYLWMDASEVLMKSPLACSKKMTEIRSQYSSMVKENPDALNSWRFYELCQKIYGTGKKSATSEE